MLNDEKSSSDMAEKPVVRVYRDPTSGKLAVKLPGKGARWRSGFADMSEAIKHVLSDLSPPFLIDYTDEKD